MNKCALKNMGKQTIIFVSCAGLVVLFVDIVGSLFHWFVRTFFITADCPDGDEVGAVFLLVILFFIISLIWLVIEAIHSWYKNEVEKCK
jgi:hypothetical protein